MCEKFDMYNLVNYFAALSKAEIAMLLDWFSDSEKIEIPFTGDPDVAYTDGNLYLDRDSFMCNIDQFYIYHDEFALYGDVGDCPMGLSHYNTLCVIQYLHRVYDFVFRFEDGFFRDEEIQE